MEPLYVLFLWHMHQPFYKNLRTNQYLLPWVLLHGTKDYLDMLLIAQPFDTIRQNFNLVPSLIVQIMDYANGTAEDIHFSLFKKPAAALRLEEKVFILKNFFNSNWDNMIRPFSRYFELLKKRGFYYREGDLFRIAEGFTEEELRDLQVLFFLSWIDPYFFEENGNLRYLKAKGKFFSEEDKTIIEEAQKEIIKRILPTYKRLNDDGKIELTTSPFYHPIIPLLIDTSIAKDSSPDISFPKKGFSHREDAKAQIVKAKELFFEVFGFYPRGMWPPEGSVSYDACLLYSEEGIEWLATDEGILFKTLRMDLTRSALGKEVYSDLLYRPYLFESEEKRLILLFRDKVLSDLISFHYAKLDPKEAVSDFLRRLRKIRDCVEGKVRNPCVLIAMDGENAWEFYKNDGRDFLMFLYEAISKEKYLVSSTVSSYLDNFSDYETLNNIYPGSWIDSNFKIWIGHPEDNLAWELLSKTRDFLESQDRERRNTLAWESMYISQGSDWNWWFGDEHSSENDEVFDFLFRENLSNVYRFLGVEPPNELSIPIITEEREIRPKYEPTAFIYPKIDGQVTNYFEWLGSGYFESWAKGVAMHEPSHLMRKLYFGFNDKSFFIRVDVDRKFLQEESDMVFEVSLIGKETITILYHTQEERIEAPFPAKAAFSDCLEVEIPKEALGSVDRVLFWCTLKLKNLTCDRIPKKGYIRARVPDEKFEAEMWYV
ncbi:MAG: glycoside hydrolase family 57 protein [Desulfobacterota bacterium]|nr:glycoside hydrolase family 57 protein [Thermodesulfobacteriota bacterium]MDW8002302.1 glycoside hydrolase family 57 protein [Deltaproteobacteria bacterium]